MATEAKTTEQSASNDAPRSPDAASSTAFTEAAGQSRPSLIGEFVYFLANNKKWWLLPILLVIALLGVLAFAGGSGLAPFIYPLM